MDYVFYKSLETSGKVKEYVISYDIACQWSKNLKSRLQTMDNDFFLFNEGVNTKYLVPKFHLPAHIMACRNQYSFNYAHGVGRTDGEGIERGWNEINPLATSTREMGPGTRRDIIDAHFGDHNWRKIISFCKSKFLKAVHRSLWLSHHSRQWERTNDSSGSRHGWTCYWL